jgi:hypothetical protein
MPKRPGEPARISYRSTARVREGDYLRTSTTGRLYLVVGVRVSRRDESRQNLNAIVMPDGHKPEPDARVFPIRWDSRSRRPTTHR